VVLLLVVASTGIVTVFDGPARQSLISSLVSSDRLPNAIALNSVAVNICRIMGPAVAGALIARLGVTPCFLLNALSFVVVVMCLRAMRESELVPARREVQGKGQVRAGLRYVGRTRELAGALVIVTVAGTFAWEFQVTLPLLTTETFHGDAGTYGLAVSSLSAGSICGAIVAARRRHVALRSLAVSAVLWGGTFLVASAAWSLPVEYGALALVGALAITFNSLAKTLLQTRSAAHMRGRVMSLWQIGWQGSTVLGAPIVGLCASLLGARAGLAAGGVATITVGLCYAFRRHPEPADGDEPVEWDRPTVTEVAPIGE
jgi:MFS family permease